MSKNDARKLNLAQLHERRKEVVRLHGAGVPVMQIVRTTGMSWPAVRSAIDRYESGGSDAIKPATRGRRDGDGRSLTQQQELLICELICNQRPDQLGLSDTMWSRSSVDQLIEQRCGLKLSERAVGNYVNRWGFVAVEPLPQQKSSKGERQAAWLATDYRALVQRVRREKADIQWLQTSQLYDSDVAASGLAGRKSDGQAAPLRYLMIAVSNQRKMRWLVSQGTPDDSQWATFLDALADDVESPILILAHDLTSTNPDLVPARHLFEHRPIRFIVAGAKLAAVEPANTVAFAEAAEDADLIVPSTAGEIQTESGNASSQKFTSSAGLLALSRHAAPNASIADQNEQNQASRLVPAHSIKSPRTPVRGPFRGSIMRIRSLAAVAAIAVVGVAVAFITLRPDALFDADSQYESEGIGAKPIAGDYWAHRVAYPTMHFSPSWYNDAKVEDALVASAVPAGNQAYRRSSQSPLALNPTNWTFLGPIPLSNAGVQVSGRVNVIAVDPTGPDASGNQTVFAASDGGGVWKSTNCCTAATTWRNTTDQPDIAGIAIGDIYIDPNNANVVYAGTGDLRYGSFSFGTSGLLKSVDKGETWTVLGSDVFTPFYPPSAGLGFPQYQAIGKVVTDPNNSNTVIVGTKTGLFVSNNAGVNWVGPCYTNNNLSQRQDITGLLARDSGGGQTNLLVAVGTRGNPTTVQPDLANLGANGVYRAALPTTGCPTLGAWTLLDNNFPAGTGNGDPTGKTLGRIELAAAKTDPNVIYAMGANSATSGVLGVWRSSNGGTTWTQTAQPADVQAQGCGNATNGGGQMWYDAGLTVDPNDANTVLLSGVDLFRSTNGGVTFQDVSCGYGNGNVHVDHHARAYLATTGGGYDSNKVLTGSDGGVFYTANVLTGTGGTAAANRPSYISLNATIGSIELYSGDITANFATSATPGASAGAQDNGSEWVKYTGDPGPAQWTVRNGGDGIYTRIEPVNELRWYYSSQNGALVVSPAGPNSSPTSAQPNPSWSSDTLSFVMPIELYRYGELDVPGSGCTTAIGCSYMLGGTNRVWETLLGGIPRTSWYVNSPNLTKGTLGNRSFINQLAHAYHSPTVVIVGTNDGNVQVGHGMNQGVTNTANWTDVTGGNSVLPNRPVMDVAIDVGDAMMPGTSSTGYASLGGFDQNTPAQPGHIYQLKCQNSCATFTWRNVSGNLPNIPANSVTFNPHIPNQVFAGTDWGLYFTNDITAASPIWFRFDNGLPKVMIWDMAIDRGATTLSVFTRGRGAWAWPLPTSISDSIFANGFDSAVP
ncbi:MAG: winged helix-turn-helix domain-containing protein [Dokdonella sp.]